MSTISFVCLAVVCVALGIINVIFNNLLGWKAIVIRGTFILSLICFGMIVTSLNDINNALPLFVVLALCLNLLFQSTCVAMSDEEKLKPVIHGAFFSVSCVLFALSAVTLAEFALLALLGGLFAGAGVGLIVSAIKKEKVLNPILMNILTFACVGLFLGLGISGVLNTKHMISSVCILASAGLMLIYKVTNACGKGQTAKTIASALYALALIAITASIYFY